jgi:hypothetical protein
MPTLPSGKNPPKKPRGLPAHLVAGNPGNRGGAKGRSGRKPDWFKSECEALTDEEVLGKVRSYLRRKDTAPDDPYWWKCAEYVTQYGKGKPAQAVIHSQDEDSPPFRFTLNLGDAAVHEGDDE